jgi:hypothetical protein
MGEFAAKQARAQALETTTEAVRQSPGKRTLVEQAYGSERAGDAQAKGGGDSSAAHSVADAGVSGPGAPLPHFDRIQQLFGRHDVSGVSSHTDNAAAAANAEMGSQAYARGNDVVFGDTPDLHTAAHEAAHVVQQRAGVHLKGGVGERGDAYERHADRVADTVVAGGAADDPMKVLQSTREKFVKGYLDFDRIVLGAGPDLTSGSGSSSDHLRDLA